RRGLRPAPLVGPAREAAPRGARRRSGPPGPPLAAQVLARDLARPGARRRDPAGRPRTAASRGAGLRAAPRAGGPGPHRARPGRVGLYALHVRDAVLRRHHDAPHALRAAPPASPGAVGPRPSLAPCPAPG